MIIFNEKNLILAGLFGAGVLVITNFLKKYGLPDLLDEAIENIDTGTDHVADYYVKKQMGWQEVQEAEGIVETYQAYIRYLGF